MESSGQTSTRLYLDLYDSNKNIIKHNVPCDMVVVKVSSNNTPISFTRVLDNNSILTGDVRDPDFENILRYFGVNLDMRINVQEIPSVSQSNDSEGKIILPGA